MEYTLACILCYYYDDSLKVIVIVQLSGIYGSKPSPRARYVYVAINP